MTTEFKIMCSLKIAHGYYAENCCDFDFVLPADTQELLRKGRLVSRVRDGVWYVLCEMQDGAATVPLAGSKIRIGLRLNNPYFSNITNFDFAAGAPLYTNQTTPNTLALTTRVTRVGESFVHPLSKTARPVTLTLRDAQSTVVQVDTIEAAHDRSDISYALTGRKPGVYSVTAVYPSETVTTQYYVDRDFQADIFGVVEISLNSAFYTTAPAFLITYTAKQQVLKYFVVVQNYSLADFNDLAVSDEGYVEEARPRINFTRVNSAAFTPDDIPPALLASGTDRVVLFKSQAVVARQELGRKKIQLKKKNDVLITHLPQPSMPRADANLIVNLSKP